MAKGGASLCAFDVLCCCCCSSSPSPTAPPPQARELRAKEAGGEVKAQRDRAAGETEGAAAERDMAAAAAAAAAEKEKRPWPAKVGAFDHTPKRPSAEGGLNYWKAEEGIVARQSDPSLAPEAPLVTRRTLPPRLPPASYATPGAPLGVERPGVYIADRAKQLAEYEAEQQQQQASAGNSPARASAAGGTKGGPAGAVGRNTAKQLRPIVDYSYPELGHSVVAQQQAHLKATTLKSHRLDVYGAPRAAVPPLPAAYRQEEAVPELNDSTLRSDGGPLRSTKNSSGSLIRLAGKAERQFVLTPAHIHFGHVVAGSVAHRPARLRNVSTGIARYSIVRQESPALRVISRAAHGPVAAGREALLTIEFAAPAEPQDFVGEVVIKTELNVFTLTVSAKVVAPPPGYQAAQLSAATLGELPAESSVVLDENKTLEEMIGQPETAANGEEVVPEENLS